MGDSYNSNMHKAKHKLVHTPSLASVPIAPAPAASAPASTPAEHASAPAPAASTPAEPVLTSEPTSAHPQILDTSLSYTLSCDCYTDLSEQVHRVPQLPGCYLWKDEHDIVIYVGKAKNLRARMLQYINQTDSRQKIPLLMSEATSFDIIVVSGEHEALVLERNLIATYKPYFNVDFKDDKSYPYIALTTSCEFPAIKFTRERHRRGDTYFGPYTDARKARELVDILRKAFLVCGYSCPQWRRINRFFQKHPELSALDSLYAQHLGEPCFDYHLKKGPGICAGALTKEEYAQHIAYVVEFLSGKHARIIHLLEDSMHEAANALEFEKAGRIHRRLQTIRALDDQQKVVFSSKKSMDVIAIFAKDALSCACVFVVREGRVIRTCDFMLDKGTDVPASELYEAFICKYYEQTDDIPRDIALAATLENEELIADWIASRRHAPAHILYPQRGQVAQLMHLVAQNAQQGLMRYLVSSGYSDRRTNEALIQLESALALDKAPMRIECYDISTFHGSYTVASMIVFTNGSPDKKAYRHFKIRAQLSEANDFLSMKEVLARRFSEKNRNDARFGTMPDLLVLDGGKPQLSAALEQFQEMGIQVNVCALAKSDEELFVPWDENPIVLPSGAASFYLIKYVRDESHRFAITFHRHLRNKGLFASELDDIKGIGDQRKRELMRRFGSLKKLREASVEEIAEVKGISKVHAQAIKRALAG